MKKYNDLYDKNKNPGLLSDLCSSDPSCHIMKYGLYHEETNYTGSLIPNPYIEFNFPGDPDKVINHKGQAIFSNFIGELNLKYDCKMWENTLEVTSLSNEICQLNQS